ncbi:hypothetical protein GCM10010924_59910 [Rhizobium wenxiniae]|nr:hypothetical protein GCM10010924_59910 [Rhizobium wenxiniae]
MFLKLLVWQSGGLISDAATGVNGSQTFEVIGLDTQYPPDPQIKIVLARGKHQAAAELGRRSFKTELHWK